MSFTPKSSFDDLFEGTILPDAQVNERKVAESALKIKIALKSIEQQKEITNQTAKLGKATWALVLVTVVLVFVTVINSILFYKSYRGSEKQIEAVNKLEKSLQGISPSIDKLAQASEKQADELKELNAGIKFMATVMPKSESYKQLQEMKKRSSRQR